MIRFDHLVMQMKELGRIADMPDHIVEHNHQVRKKLRNNVKILESVAEFEEGGRENDVPGTVSARRFLTRCLRTVQVSKAAEKGKDKAP
jgi:hypothetical protein